MGVWLRSPVFTHGQLYVASSRTGDPDGLKFAVMQQPGEPLFATANVVFKEVLLNDSVTAPASEDEWISSGDEWMMQTYEPCSHRPVRRFKKPGRF